jgi:uncharacterized RDD family membrane protein YckC
MQGQGTNATESSAPARTASLSGRLLAFIIDLTLVGLLSKLARGTPFEAMSDVGKYGPLIGWGMVLAYFAGFDSTLGSGRSLGKRLLGICVVRSDNTYISPIEAALRAAVVTAPFFLNDTRVAADPLMIQALLNMAVSGLLVSMLYLLALSNDSRQVLLHDLALGTLVVRQEDRERLRPLPTIAPIRRGHLIVVGLILLASLLLPLIEAFVWPASAHSWSVSW